MKHDKAFEMMKSGYNIFLTGEAGAGKTFLLNRYISFLNRHNIRYAVTASTGIAATHLNGVTLDSWSGMGLREKADFQEASTRYSLKKRVKSARVLIIDEISMLDCDKFDETGKLISYLRGSSQPFGGLQLVLSGDFFQLPPVSQKREKPFIFRSKVWNALNLKISYLAGSARQKDISLIQILNDIRKGSITEKSRILLSSTSGREFGNIPYTNLYTHNSNVDAENRERLLFLKGDIRQYYMSSVGSEKIVGNLKKSCMAPELLELKKDAVVMFVKNNFDKGYVNGTMGKVIGFDGNEEPVVRTALGKTIHVSPENWEIKEDGKTVAGLTQIPLRLAWAITIHKSQGMTIDAAQIDLSRSFVEGMGYVALSRLRSLSGLKLDGYNSISFSVDPDVAEYDRRLKNLSIEHEMDYDRLGFWGRWMAKRRFLYSLTST